MSKKYPKEFLECFRLLGDAASKLRDPFDNFDPRDWTKKKNEALEIIRVVEKKLEEYNENT